MESKYFKTGDQWFVTKSSPFVEEYTHEVLESQVPRKEILKAERRAKLAKAKEDSGQSAAGPSNAKVSPPKAHIDSTTRPASAKAKSSKETARKYNPPYTQPTSRPTTSSQNFASKKASKYGPLKNFSNLQQQQQSFSKAPTPPEDDDSYESDEEESDEDVQQDEFSRACNDVEQRGVEMDAMEDEPVEGVDVSFRFPTRELPPLTAESRKRVDKLQRRLKGRYEIFEAASSEIALLEAEDAANTKEPKAWNARIEGEIVTGDLSTQQCPFDFEKDYFAMKDLAEFCEKKNVVAINFYDFFLQNDERSPYCDENGNCVYCAAHGVETAVAATAETPSSSSEPTSTTATTVKHECPRLECNCVECHILDKMKLDDE